MALKINKYLYWIPRILSILFILFLALFSLDVFGEGYGFWGTLLAFLMHNIPVFVLIAILAIGWKREWLPGIGFILGGLLYILLILRNQEFQWYYLAWIAQISIPAFIIGILFLINWKKRKLMKSKKKY